jgi:hypothetical protein
MPSTILHPPSATKISAATMSSAVSRSPVTRLSVVTWIQEIQHLQEICIVIQKSVGGCSGVRVRVYPGVTPVMPYVSEMLGSELRGTA